MRRLAALIILAAVLTPAATSAQRIVPPPPASAPASSAAADPNAERIGLTDALKVRALEHVIAIQRAREKNLAAQVAAAEAARLELEAAIDYRALEAERVTLEAAFLAGKGDRCAFDWTKLEAVCSRPPAAKPDDKTSAPASPAKGKGRR